MLFINFLCLLYLMVFVTSHTISRSYARTELTDENYDSFNDIDFIKHKPRHGRVHSNRRERCFGRKSKQKIAENKLKNLTKKPTVGKEAEDDRKLQAFKIHQNKKEKETTHGDNTLIDKWEGTYFNQVTDTVGNPFIYNNLLQYVNHTGRPRTAKNEKNNKGKIKRKKKHGKIKRKMHDTYSNLERPPAKDKRSLQKANTTTTASHHTTKRNYNPKYKDITQILSEMSTKLDELRRLYSTSEYFPIGDITASTNGAKFDSQAAKTETDSFEGTAAIEDLLNEVKLRAIDMMAKNIPSITDVITNAVTETTYTVDPMLNHLQYISPLFALSTLVTINEAPRHVETVPNFMKTAVTNDDNFNYFIFQTKPNRFARSAVANSTGRLMTLAQNLEGNLEGKLKNIYHKLRGNYPQDSKTKSKNVTSTTKMTKKNKDALHTTISGKSQSQSQTKSLKEANSQSENTNCTATFETTTPLNRKSERHVSSTTATPVMEDNDYAMLALYEHMLAKSQESNILKFLSTKLTPTLKRNARIAEEVQTKPAVYDEDNENLGATSPLPYEDTTYEGLSKKLAYNDFVNGFRHYLQFEKEMGRSNFSNLVRYQAHRHHDVNDIGKYILDKIPQIPSPLLDRYKRGFFDTYDEDQDVSTKSEDSWFKKHFYYFVERSGPPKKYHTSQLVPLKSPVEEWSTETINRKLPKDHVALRVRPIDQEKGDSDFDLDDLSALLKQRGDYTDPVTFSTKSEKISKSRIAGKNASHSTRFFDKILSGIVRPVKKATPKGISETREYLNEATEARVRRHDESNKPEQIDDIKFGNEPIKTTPSKNLKQGAEFGGNDKKKLSYANVDIVPADKKTGKKKGRLHKWLDKLKSHKKSHKDRKKRDVQRLPRFNIVNSLRNLFNANTRSDASRRLSEEDYDLATKRLKAFKPVHYDKPSSIDELSFDMTNEPETVERTEVNHATVANKANNNMVQAKTSTVPDLNRWNHEEYNFGKSTNEDAGEGTSNILSMTSTYSNVLQEDNTHLGKIDEIIKEIDNIDLRITSNTPQTSTSKYTSHGFYTSVMKSKQENPEDIAITDHIKLTIDGMNTNSTLSKLARYPISKINNNDDNYDLDTQIESSRVQIFNNLNQRELNIDKKIDRLRNINDGELKRNPAHDVKRILPTNAPAARLRIQGKKVRDYEHYTTAKTTHSDDFNDLIIWNSDILHSGSTWRNILQNIGVAVPDVETTTEGASINDQFDDFIETKMHFFSKDARDSLDDKKNLMKHVKTGDALRNRLENKNKKIFVATNRKEFSKETVKSELKRDSEEKDYVTSVNYIVGRLNSLIGKMPEDIRKNAKIKKYNPPEMFVDSTIFAYDDSIGLITDEDEGKKLSRSSMKSDMGKHFTPTKTRFTPPRQYYTTPLPMESQEFENFLKMNEIDVKSVTSPESADISAIVAKHLKKHPDKAKSKFKEMPKLTGVTENSYYVPPLGISSIKNKVNEKQPNMSKKVNYNATKHSKSGIVEDTLLQPYSRHELNKRKLKASNKKGDKVSKALKAPKKTTESDKEMEITFIDFDNDNKVQAIPDLDIPYYDDIPIHNEISNKMDKKDHSHDVFLKNDIVADKTRIDEHFTNEAVKHTTKVMKSPATKSKASNSIKHNNLLYYTKPYESSVKDPPKSKQPVKFHHIFHEHDSESLSTEFAKATKMTGEEFSAYLRSGSMRDEHFDILKYLPKHDKQPKRIQINGQSYKYDIEYRDLEDYRLRMNEEKLFKESVSSIADLLKPMPKTTVASPYAFDKSSNSYDYERNTRKSTITKKTKTTKKGTEKEKPNHTKPMSHDSVYASKKTTEDIGANFLDKLVECFHKTTPKVNVVYANPYLHSHEDETLHTEASRRTTTTTPVTTPAVVHTGLTRYFLDKIMGRVPKPTKSKNTRASFESPDHINIGFHKYQMLPRIYRKPRRQVNSKMDKREAVESFTAKSVAALEVVVDLVKGTTNPVQMDIISDLSNLGQSVAPTINNAIQVHIALPRYPESNSKRSAERIRKVFQAKLRTPVDLEYQINSMEEATAPTVLPPGMYLLVENHNATVTGGNFFLKPFDQNVELISKKVRQADVTKEYDHAEKVTTTTSNKLSKVTLSKDFISVVNEHLQKLHGKMNAKYTAHKIHVRAASCGNKRGWFKWKKLRRLFENERACNCKCRANKTMCRACAASDAVMGELIFEINNLVNYMSEHCTEIQTYFLMNPSGGKKLRDAVKKVDRNLQNYYKRVKGKCHGKTCDAYRFIDKRDFVNYSGIPQHYVESKLTDEIEKIAYDINNASQLKLCFDDKLKEGSYKLIHLVSNCAKDDTKRNDVHETKNSSVKNVYSLDNVHVNIVCNTDTTELPLTLNGITTNLPEHVADYTRKRNNWFVKHPFRHENMFSHFRRTTFSSRYFKREVDRHDSPLNVDSGGSFWNDFLKKSCTQKTTIINDVNKQNVESAQSDIKITNLNIFDTITRGTSYGKSTNGHLYTDTAKLYETAKIGATVGKAIDQTLNYNMNELFRLLGNENVTNDTTPATIRKVNSATPNKNPGTLCECCKRKKNKKGKCKCKCKSGKNTTKAISKTHCPKASTPIRHMQNKTISTPKSAQKTTQSSTTATTISTKPTTIQIPYQSILENKNGASSDLINKINRWKNATLGLLKTNSHRNFLIENIPESINVHEISKLSIPDTKTSVTPVSEFMNLKAVTTMNDCTNVTTANDNPTIIIVNDDDGVEDITAVPFNMNYTDFTLSELPTTTSVVTHTVKKVSEADNVYKSLLLTILKYEGKRLDDELRRVYGENNENNIIHDATEPIGSIINVRIRIINETQPQTVATSTTTSTPRDYDILAPLRTLELPSTTEDPGVVSKLLNRLAIKRKHSEKAADGVIRSLSSTPFTPDVIDEVIDDQLNSEGQINADVLVGVDIPTTAHYQLTSTRPNELGEFAETGDPPRLCDLHDTFTHVLTALERMNKEYFQIYVRNLSCHKYRNAPKYFYITTEKTKSIDSLHDKDNSRKDAGIKWDWIRNKRSLLQSDEVFDDVKETNDLDEEAAIINDNDDETHSVLEDFLSNDGFEKMYKDEDGIYRSFEMGRKKRTISDVKALSRELRNLPPIIVPKNEIYAMIGDSVTLTCPNDIADGPYSWWMESGLQDNVEVDGPRLLIRRVAPENTGSYTCSKGDAQLNSTQLHVVSLPHFRVVFLPVYRSSHQCDAYDLRAMHQLGDLMTEAACPDYSCSVEIKHPSCVTDETEQSWLVSATASIRPAARAAHCGVECRRDLECSLALLSAGNAPALAAVPVILSSEVGNVTLSPTQRDRRGAITQSLRNADWTGSQLSALSPGDVDVVLSCPAGYFLVSGSKICVASPPSQESLGYRHRRLHRYDWWPAPYTALAMAGCVVLGAACGCAADALARRLERRGAHRVPAFREESAPAPRRKISPSRVILPRLFRNASSRISQDTKLDGKRPPPLPPIDFDS